MSGGSGSTDSVPGRIERTLAVLVGLPLWASGRAALQWFQFGARQVVMDVRGGRREAGTYALHVDCAWRLVEAGRIVVGSGDRFYRAGGDPYHDLDDFDWDRPGDNRCDERMAQFFEQHDEDALTIVGVQADASGGLRLRFRGGCALEVFPVDSLPDEFWRLLQPAAATPHFVVTGLGIQAGE